MLLSFHTPLPPGKRNSLREPGHVKTTCPEFSDGAEPPSKLGLGLKKLHCLRNDWTAFAWGWDGITASKLGLSSNGLPGESVS